MVVRAPALAFMRGRSAGGREMKRRLIAGLALCLAVAFPASAMEPLAKHPPEPVVTAAKAIQIAADFLGDDAGANRYCSSVRLAEPNMVPAPRGSSRHWIVTFQTAGEKRTDRRDVYVDMKGRASDTVPPRGQGKHAPNKPDPGDGE